jgi:zinc/manganese transport system substrate-binding protein
MLRRALLIGLLAQLIVAPAMAAGAAAVPVVASFSVLADMVRQIGGEIVNVTSLVPPDMDAHSWQPSVADSRTLTESALLVENGLGLEGWMSRLSGASGFRGIRIVASAGVTPRTIREGKATSIDPHAWQDPRNGVTYARAIAEGLTAADPLRAEAYRMAAAAYITEIQRTDAWIASRFEAIPPKARRIITNHEGFGYYGDRYGVSFLAADGISAHAAPSAKAIAALVAQIKRERIRTVFLQNMNDPRMIEMLAKETGATVSGPLYASALSKPDGPAPDYLAMLRHNTTLFERAMRPT